MSKTIRGLRNNKNYKKGINKLFQHNNNSEKTQPKYTLNYGPYIC